ncbi:MAG TPA: CoA transferase [Gammaproteobacteria bacterium]|nr:CoA transferase [Gammaproteobacteria bacterium]
MKLEGIQVLDLSLFLPGPLLTQMMADQGAEVIKLEPRGSGEPNRSIGQKRDGVSVYFANTHRGKRSVQLNLKTPAGLEMAMKLAAEADVIVEAFRPGVISRLGLGYEAVKAVNPDVVYISLSAFGQDGPYLKKPAHDLATEAYAGVLSTNLGFDGKPAMPAIPAADMLAATMGLSAVLMALLRRKDTGRGDYIDLAMMDSLIACLPNSMGSVFADREAPSVKQERIWGGNAMYNIYQTADQKFIVLGASEIHFAENLLRKFERLDLLPLCAQPPGPSQEPVREFFCETFQSQSQDYWVQWFEDVDAAFAPVNSLRQGADNEQVRYRQMIVVDENGREHIGIPMKFLDEPGQVHFAAPELGQHNTEIARRLGYSESQIRQLQESGAFA